MRFRFSDLQLKGNVNSVIFLSSFVFTSDVLNLHDRQLIHPGKVVVVNQRNSVIR